MLSTLNIWHQLQALLPGQSAPVAPRSRALPAFTLAYRSARTVHLRAGQCLTVRSGQLWLTRTGQPDDHVLQPGGSLVAQRDETVVIEGFSVQPCHYDVQRVRQGARHK